MEYITRYGLEFNPFLKNSKEILVDTSEYKETLFRLDYLAKTKGFGLLTGSPGRGKTTAVRNRAASLNPSLYEDVLFCRNGSKLIDLFTAGYAISAPFNVKKGASFNVLNNSFAKSFAFCPNVYVLPPNIPYAGLYHFPNKTLIFKLSSVIPVPAQTKTYPSLFLKKHNSIFSK